MELEKLTAAEIGRGIDAGRLDPLGVAEAFVSSIKAHPAKDEIYARLCEERTMEEAEKASARAKSGTRLGPLDGVPVSWKDLFDTKGIATESGTPLLKGRIPDEDAIVLKHAAAAGTVCLGKTHQTEFAFSGIGINPNTATPPNIYMPGHVPGGSSSGAAASITHGLAPVAIGSDTGGSVRIPACWNSLVGMKTTHGLLSLENVVPLCSGFDTVGPLAKTVEDAALMFTALGGGEVDPGSVPEASDLTFAVIGKAAMDDCEPAVVAAYEAALERLTKAGVKLVGIEPAEWQAALELGPTLFPFEAWQAWGELIAANPDVMFRPVEDRFRQGEHISRQAYDDAWVALKKERASFWETRKAFDGFVLPTLAGLPPRIEDIINVPEVFSKTNLLTLRNTRHVNLMGGCASTLPLPEKCIGFQLMGKPNDDVRVLQMSAAIERVVNP